jgi:hypothetical protein
MTRNLAVLTVLTLGALALSDCVCVIARCGPGNCLGCCDINDNCQSGDLNIECGGSGAACSDCTSAGEVCSSALSCVVAFPGTYGASGTITQTPDTGSPATNSYQGTVNISFGTTSNDLLVDLPSGTLTNCSIAATVTSSSTFNLQSGLCSQWTDIYGCTEVWSYSGGSGALSGNTLTVSATGTYTQTNCPAGLTGVNGTLAVSYTGSR